MVIERSTDVDISRSAATGNTTIGIDVTFGDGITVTRSLATGNGLGGIVDRFSSTSRLDANVMGGVPSFTRR